MIGQAIPGFSMKIQKVSGIVERVVWRGAISYDQSFTKMDGEFAIKKITHAPSWVIILKDVEGLNETQISEISSSFNLNEPQVAFSRMCEKNPDMLYFWLRGESNLKIQVGCKVTITNIKFSSDERGAGIIYDNITVIPK
jgi:hypothetical protein